MRKKLSVLTVENIKSAVFWNVTVCSFVVVVNNVEGYTASTCSGLLWNIGNILPDYQCHIQGDSRLSIYDRSQDSAFRIISNRSTNIEVAWSVSILIKIQIKAFDGVLKAVLVPFGLCRFLNYLKYLRLIGI